MDMRDYPLFSLETDKGRLALALERAEFAAYLRRFGHLAVRFRGCT